MSFSANKKHLLGNLASHLGVAVPGMLAVALFGITIFLIIIPFTENAVIEKKQQATKDLTRLGWGVLAYHEKLERAGVLSRPQAQAQAREQLGALRYGFEDKNYFWITDLDAKVLLHPPQPELEGKNQAGLTDASGRRIISEAVTVAKEKGQGLLIYDWPSMNDPNRTDPKHTYVMLFQPWKWVIGTGLHLDDIQNEIHKLRSMLTIIGGMVLACVLMLAFVIVWRQHRLGQEKVAAQEDSEQAREQYRRIVETANEGIWAVDGSLTTTYVNQKMAGMLGYQPAEMLGRPLEGFIPTRDLERFQKRMARRRGNQSETYEGRFLAKDGREVLCLVSAAPVLDNQGGFAGSFAMMTDITEGKRRERELRESEWLFRAIFEQSYHFIGTLAPSGILTKVNQTAVKFAGTDESEVLGKPFWDTPWWAHSPELRDRLRQAIFEAATGRFVNFEVTHPDPQGNLVDVDFSIKPVTDDKGRVVLLVPEGRDITQRKRLEAQLAQSQKMEAIGLLAGGVAHDFNNMLSVILGYAELLRPEFPPDSPGARKLAQIEKAAEHSRDITRQLLAFSRQQVISPRPQSLNKLVNGTLKTLARLIGEDVSLSFKPAEGLWLVKVDPSQVDQILVNLAVNARDAMPEGGRLMVETGNLVLDEQQARRHPETLPGEYVRLTVADTGQGMDQATADRIFEPFFTTKAMGQGTGLGLATVYGVVKQNGGFIEVTSEPGRGSTFIICLPRTHEHEAISPASADCRPTPASGAIILVEDDHLVRQVTASMLEDLGYAVVAPRTTTEAIELFSQEGRRFDLLITDMIMPQMSGKDLRERVKALDPGIRVLFISGYPSDIAAQRGVLEEGVHFLAKPFTINDLACKVREAMA